MIELADISVNNELTAQRLRELLESATQKQIDDIEATFRLMDTYVNEDTTIYKVCDTGTVNIIITNLFARSFNVNPFYITGDVDEPGEFNDDNLKAIKIKKGYAFLDEEESTEIEPEFTVHIHPALEDFLRNRNTDETKS